jgi:hypothetical protein
MKNNQLKFADWITILEVDEGATQASAYINKSGQIMNSKVLDGESLIIRLRLPKEKHDIFQSKIKTFNPSFFHVLEQPKPPVIKTIDINLGKKYVVRLATVDEILNSIHS